MLCASGSRPALKCSIASLINSRPIPDQPPTARLAPGLRPPPPSTAPAAHVLVRATVETCCDASAESAVPSHDPPSPALVRASHGPQCTGHTPQCQKSPDPPSQYH